MNHNEFYNLLIECRLISPIWKYELDLFKKQIEDDYLKLFLVYFALVDKGNIALPLKLDEFKKVSKDLVEGLKAMDEDSDEDIISTLSKEISNLEATLSKVEKEVEAKLNTIFEVSDGYLYLKKYNHARVSIIEDIKRLFAPRFSNIKKFEIEDFYKKDSSFSLSDGQREIVNSGLNKNLVITGGPGTGKTTSIVYLLFYLLSNNINYNVYLASSSGKAASRMKESILNGMELINPLLKDKYSEVNKKISGAVGSDISEYTIHRLLEVDSETSKFKYNENRQFDENSIFVIDEASMIDINLFSSLLKAIKTGSRLFILGDKNQLPSVGAGEVFSELLRSKMLTGNEEVVEIKKSQRFKEDTTIYKLSLIINNDSYLDLKKESFLDPSLFKVEKVDKAKCPVYYYLNSGDKLHQQKIIQSVLDVWVKCFFLGSDIKSASTNLKEDSDFDKVYNFNERSKVITAENDGVRGIDGINDYIKKIIYKRNELSLDIIRTMYSYHMAGEVMMITKNNKALDLYNGDSGVLVSFSNDATLYFMVKKDSKIVYKEGKVDDKIFKIGSFVFYPLRMIPLSDISLSYAITVHKSQGSDYENILVIPPTSVNHSLLNRQIIYTAITRTKGNTYILSNLEALLHAKSNVLRRITNIDI